MNTRTVDLHGILERCGADANAPEGSQAWALAQVDAAVTELIDAVQPAITDEGMSQNELDRLRAAVASIGGANG